MNDTRRRHAQIAAVATDLEAHALALDEQCPVCGVDPGDVCIGQITHEPMRACHWQRVRLATRRTDETP